MSRFNSGSTWRSLLVIVVLVLVAMRMMTALQTDVGAIVALRTYVFWGLVCMPVAYLTDVLIRTISQYRIVRLTVARVRSRR